MGPRIAASCPHGFTYLHQPADACREFPCLCGACSSPTFCSCSNGRSGSRAAYQRMFIADALTYVVPVFTTGVPEWSNRRGELPSCTCTYCGHHSWDGPVVATRGSHPQRPVLASRCYRNRYVGPFEIAIVLDPLFHAWTTSPDASLSAAATRLLSIFGIGTSPIPQCRRPSPRLDLSPHPSGCS